MLGMLRFPIYNLQSTSLASRALVLRDPQPPERQRDGEEQRGRQRREPGRPGRQPEWVGAPKQVQRGRVVGERDRDDKQKDAANPAIVDAQRIAGASSPPKVKTLITSGVLIVQKQIVAPITISAV